MNRKQKRLQEKIARKKSGAYQANDEAAILQTAGAYFNSGQFRNAAKSLEKVLRINPDNFDATNALAIANANLGNNEDALALFEKTTRLRPDDAVAHYNFARALEGGGQIDKALASYLRSVEIDPYNAAGYVNLGNLFHANADSVTAVGHYQRALEIDGSLAVAHINLGNVFKEQERFDDAAECYLRGLAIEPNYVEAIISLADTHAKMGQLDKAAAGYQKAVSLRPDDALLHYNLGTALQELGHLDKAVACFQNAIELAPDYAKAWNNCKYALKSRLFLQGQQGGIEEGFSPAACATYEFFLLTHYLDSFRPHTADDSFKKAMAALPAKSDEEIQVGGSGAVDLPDKLVALLHFGRSGSGLMHSLIDSHPEISTLPGVYLRGYFNSGVWHRLAADGWRGLPERFADLFAVLFDANSPNPVPSRLGEESAFLGREEGMTTVGENRDEALSLDREAFCSNALQLIEGLDKVDPESFLMVVHQAFEKVLATKTKKKTIFYHIHNPDDFAALNFQRYMPDARLLMMVREPIESCESWVRPFFEKNDYGKIIHRIISMLFGFDRVAFHGQEARGVRLEDLKTRPHATMATLCDWLGVAESPCLYEMTAQGKKWWGDPSSPDYQKDEQMSAFGDTSHRSPRARVFSEKDRLILRTLFYPFNVRFKYERPDMENFTGNLKEIRPMLNDMLDFEKALSEKANITADQIRRSADFILLRASLIDRWEVLSELGDYPHMITPLEVG
ncbi:MAG: tetratricopeptide repeat protein [Rhodospirillales bacterium]|nr:tetratricopeptide repeat protein [Rhodospirillales bacterium]